MNKDNKFNWDTFTTFVFVIGPIPIFIFFLISEITNYFFGILAGLAVAYYLFTKMEK